MCWCCASLVYIFAGWSTVVAPREGVVLRGCVCVLDVVVRHKAMGAREGGGGRGLRGSVPECLSTVRRK